MDKCPECGYEEEEYWGPPMTQEDRDIMKRDNPIGYATMVYAENKLLDSVSGDNSLLKFLNQGKKS